MGEESGCGSHGGFLESGNSLGLQERWWGACQAHSCGIKCKADSQTIPCIAWLGNACTGRQLNCPWHFWLVQLTVSWHHQMLFIFPDQRYKWGKKDVSNLISNILTTAILEVKITFFSWKRCLTFNEIIVCLGKLEDNINISVWAPVLVASTFPYCPQRLEKAGYLHF